MIRGREPPGEAGDCLVGELVERAEVDARRGGPVFEPIERALEAQLRGGVEAHGARARPFEQSAAFGPGRFDHYLGFALCRGDCVRRVAFGRENPVDCPSNG